MTVITELSHSERRVCSHLRTTHAVLLCRDGTPQVRLACVDCGHRVGEPEPRDKHPKWAVYPRIVKSAEATRIERPAVGNYETYLASPVWKEKRRYYVAKALNRCQLCNKPGGPGGRGLNAHHRTYTRLGAELDADVIVLCRECHERHHGHIAAHQEAA